VVPTPVRITSEVLAPIDLRAAVEHLSDEHARVEHAHQLVYGALVHAVATMQHGVSVASPQTLERERSDNVALDA
jgi:hypothetical protein